MAIFKKHYSIVLVFVLSLFALLAFVPFGSGANPLAIGMTMDAGHAFAFILLSGLLYLAFEQHGKWRAVMTSVIISVLLMAVVELVQPYVGRTASLADMQTGLLGVLIAVSGMIVWRNLHRWQLRVAHIALVVMILGWTVLPAWNEWRSLWLREQQFPLLGDFEHTLEQRLWKPTGVAHGRRTQAAFSDKHAVSGVNSLKVETINGSWSGVRYAAGDQNWQGYQALSITLYNPGADFNMNIRIDDGVSVSPRYSERYNGHFQIRKGQNTLLIPLTEIAAGPKGRLLKLDRIRKMILFLNKNEQPQSFYLDNVHLVP